jgi:hypothetical protein
MQNLELGNPYSQGLGAGYISTQAVNSANVPNIVTPVPLPDDQYKDLVLTPSLIKQRDKEFLQLKEAYNTIRGDTWETATGIDSIGQQNLQAFKDRWEQILEEGDFESFDYNKEYGGYAPLGETGYNSLIGMGGYANKSGYLGG